MRINSPMLGTVDFSMIPSYFIDDATLYHGASSIGLTGGGLGGAIDLQTKPLQKDGIQVKYIQGIGSFDTYDQFLRLTYGNYHWQTSSRVVYSTAKNDYKYTNYDKKTDVYENDILVNSYHPKERNKSGYFDDLHALQEIYYRSNRGHRWGISSWYTASKRGLPFLSVDYKQDSEFTNEQKIHTSRTVLSWDYLQDCFKWSAKGGYVYSDIAYDYFTKRQDAVSTDITHSRCYVNTWYGQLAVEYSPVPRLFFSADVNIYENQVKSKDKSPYHIGNNYDKKRFEMTACLSARWKPAERLAIAACLREEMYGKNTIPVIPALFLDYVISERWNLVAKASIARNYRYPSLDDLYFQPGGNPELEAEHGFTYDGGVEFQLAQKHYLLKGNATVFNSYIDDWILWTPNTKGFWQPSNVREVHNYGVEMTSDNMFFLSKNTVLDISGNFAWTPSKNYGEQINSNDASYEKQLCYIPEYSAAVTTRLSWKNWNFSYKWSYYSERFTTTSNEVSYITGRLKPYYMSDFSIEKRFSWKWTELSVKTIVNNLLDSEYVTVLSRPMPRRNYELFLEISPKFGRKNNNLNQLK